LEIPDAEDVQPQIEVAEFIGVQPYKLVIFGEKTSLEPVVAPIAERYGADLYLTAGDISDTFLYQIARIGSEDGRPSSSFRTPLSALRACIVDGGV
jgi:hypothetical protein